MLVVEDLWQALLEGHEAWERLAARVKRLKEVAAEAQVNLALYHLMGANYRRAEALLGAARPILERGGNSQSLLRLETALLHLLLARGGEMNHLTQTVVSLRVPRPGAVVVRGPARAGSEPVIHRLGRGGLRFARDRRTLRPAARAAVFGRRVCRTETRRGRGVRLPARAARR